MYKVFINEKLIIFTTLLKSENNYPIFSLKEVVFDEIVHKLRYTNLEGVCLHSSDVEGGFKKFLNHFKVVTAAGGLVRNKENEILFIFRGNRWDLPKGRTEKGESIEETSVREVEEECGISNLKIEGFLLKTYHIYFTTKNTEIKETFWYLMNSDFKGELKPQLEEGITEVGFKKESEVSGLFENSYGNIELVYQKYKELTSF